MLNILAYAILGRGDRTETNCCCAFTSRGRIDAAGTRGSDRESAAATGDPEDALT